jgi:hypothetical protein
MTVDFRRRIDFGGLKGLEQVYDGIFAKQYGFFRPYVGLHARTHGLHCLLTPWIFKSYLDVGPRTRCENMSTGNRRIRFSSKSCQSLLALYHPTIRAALPHHLCGISQLILFLGFFSLPLEEFYAERMIQSEIELYLASGICIDGFPH